VQDTDITDEWPLVPMNVDRLFDIRASESSCPAIWSEQRKEQAIARLQNELKEIEDQAKHDLMVLNVRINAKEEYIADLENRQAQADRNLEATREIDEEMAQKKIEQEALYEQIRESYK